MALSISISQDLKPLSSHALNIIDSNNMFNTKSNASQLAIVFFVCACCFRYMAMALASSRGLEPLSSRALRIIERNVILNTHSNAFQSAIVFWLLISLHGPRALELSRY